MKKIIWQLPFKQSNLTDKDWLHYKSKYHAHFINEDSLCTKYGFSDYHDKKSLDEIIEEFGDYRPHVCKVCMNKINKMIEKEEREKPKYQVIIEASSFDEACSLQLQIAEDIGIGSKLNIIKGKVKNLKMNINPKLNSYINILEKAKKLEAEIREFYIKKYGEEFYNRYIEDIIRDNILHGDIQGTLNLINEVIKEKTIKIK